MRSVLNNRVSRIADIVAEHRSSQSRISAIVDRIIALEFDNRKQMEDYRREHDVRPGTKLVVKTPAKHQTGPLESPSSPRPRHLTSKAVYTKKDGWRAVDGKELPEHVRKQAIPPAWKDVHYDPNPKADLVVQGRDSKGRIQSRYSDSHKAMVAAEKFARISELIKKIGEIKGENEKNGKGGKKDDAECLRLIMETGIRPGSDRDTKAEKQAYGATTLRGRHVVVKKDGVHLDFIGKKGVHLDIPVMDKKTAENLLGRAKEAGKSGRLFNTNEGKLLEYTHTLDGGGFKVKDMRTMVGTTTAISLVKKMPVPQSESEYRKQVKEVAVSVSKKLGNTPVVCLQAYISPVVFTTWRQIGWELKGAA
jgi:DNA topoisomerase-1